MSVDRVLWNLERAVEHLESVERALRGLNRRSVDQVLRDVRMNVDLMCEMARNTAAKYWSIRCSEVGDDG